MNIQFRIIEPSQILTIVPLLYKLNRGAISEETLKERALEMSQQSDEGLGIYDNAQLIGICGMWYQTRHYAGKSCEIDHVILKDEYRNQGIGGQMMEFIYEYVGEKQCNWVELNTYVDNYPSHKFYSNQDFIARGYHFIKPLND